MMKGILTLFAVAAIVSTQNAGAQPVPSAMPQSNTVKSSELIADFSVIKDASANDVVAQLNLFKAPSSPDRGPMQLTISADETITLAIADKTVVCQPTKECRLPYVKNGLYRVELKRFNGEAFINETTLPNETVILTPAENSTALKKDEVHTSWTVARAEGPRGITLSIYLGEQVKTCATEGNISWDTEGTATVPSNYLGNCIPPLRSSFSVFYVNPSSWAGIAGGTFKGYSTARVSFTYIEGGIRFDQDQSALSAQELSDLVATSRSGSNKPSTQTILR